MFDLMNDKSRRGVDWNGFGRFLVTEYLQMIRYYILPVLFNRTLLLSGLICIGAEWSYRQGQSDAHSSGAIIAMAILWACMDTIYVAFTRGIVDPTSPPLLGVLRAEWMAGGQRRKDVTRSFLCAVSFCTGILMSWLQNGTVWPLIVFSFLPLLIQLAVQIRKWQLLLHEKRIASSASHE